MRDSANLPALLQSLRGSTNADVHNAVFHALGAPADREQETARAGLTCHYLIQQAGRTPPRCTSFP